MTDYVKSTNFASKDALATGNPLKIVKGTEIDAEFNNIATAVATKADLNSPALIGSPTAPTPASGNNTTAVATTAFVSTAVTNERTATATLTNKTLTSPTINTPTVSSPTMTGTPVAPTASLGTNTTQVATTAFVTSAVAAAQSSAAITGGTITGITDLAIADGGTGSSTAAGARTNLGTNDAANITTGTIATARLGSGTASSSTFLRGDQTYAAPPMVGVSQSWQNVTSSRTSGTTYTNNTGKPIMVNIVASNGVYTTTTLTVSGVEIGRCSNPTTSSGAEATLSAIVPDGATYSSSGFIQGWFELR